jgi:hypothetical protein
VGVEVVQGEEGGHGEKCTKKPLLCTGCGATYCDRECQADDWKRHAGDCKRWQVPEPGDAGHWGRRELVLLLENPFQMPHDDLEVLDELGLTVGDLSAHPVPLRFGPSGQPTRPSASDVVWLMRGMAAVLAMLDGHLRECVDIRPMLAPVGLDFARHTNEDHWYDAVPAMEPSAAPMSVS